MKRKHSAGTGKERKTKKSRNRYTTDIWKDLKAMGDHDQYFVTSLVVSSLKEGSRVCEIGGRV